MHKRILVCPLDWGLGHATRCVPIIRLLINSGAKVIIAADNGPFDLLKKEFDHYRKLQKPHPFIVKNKLKFIPFQHEKIDYWRDALRAGGYPPYLTQSESRC